MENLAKIVEQLRKSGEYRIIEKYQKPTSYNISTPTDKKLIGVFLDTESTGLSYVTDKLIELGMVKFEYSEDGRIFNILDEFHSYQDPQVPISEYITKLTGITDEMVKGHSIESEDVAKYLENVNIIISHNAKFDRGFFETHFPKIPMKAWGCSMNNIDWSGEGLGSLKLEYIAYKYNFFYEGHRAIIDCLAGIHVLSQSLFNSKDLALKILLANARELDFKIWAKDAQYQRKDLLKNRGYRWGTHPTQKFNAWHIDVKENAIADEIKYLKTDIYKSKDIEMNINIHVDIVDAFSRYSTKHQRTSKYAEKLDYIKTLCKEEIK
jgi:DNA polymerase-3 subunit epsilon